VGLAEGATIPPQAEWRNNAKYELRCMKAIGRSGSCLPPSLAAGRMTITGQQANSSYSVMLPEIDLTRVLNEGLSQGHITAIIIKEA